MVNKGSTQGVRSGVGAEVVQNGQVIATGIVEQSFPALTHDPVVAGLPLQRRGSRSASRTWATKHPISLYVFGGPGPRGAGPPRFG